MIDIVIEQEHPLIEQVRTAAGELGARLTTCANSEWNQAVTIGQSEWIVLVDGRAPCLPVDLAHLVNHISETDSPVWLSPLSGFHSSDSSAWGCLPPIIAAHWNNPIRYAVVCVRRSQLANLPTIPETQTEPLWKWLTRVVLQPGRASCGKPAARPGLENSAAISMELPALVPQSPNASWIVEQISGLKPSQLVPEKKSEADSVAVKAGLLQWHDALDASHELAQSVEGLGVRQAGDYWHAIMHRREPDYGNSKYWYRQFRTHPIFADLAAIAKQELTSVSDGASWASRLLGRDPWDPFAFVDLCEACADSEESPLGIAARRIQAAEMRLLIAATWRDASGK